MSDDAERAVMVLEPTKEQLREVAAAYSGLRTGATVMGPQAVWPLIRDMVLEHRDHELADEVMRLQGRVTAGDKAVEILTGGLATAEIELMQARADLAAAVEERERLRGERDDFGVQAATAKGQWNHWETEAYRVREGRDRLRAVLAALEPVLGNIRDAADTDTAWLHVAQAYDRARAGMDQPTEVERKAKAFDNVRALWWEFCDVEEGRAALRCLGEFIGEWEHHHERRQRAEAISDAAAVVAEKMLAPVFAKVAGPAYASVEDLEAGLETAPPLCGSEADDAAHYAYRKEGAAEERAAVVADLMLGVRTMSDGGEASIALTLRRTAERIANGEHRGEDLEAAGVNHRQQDDSANAQPAGVAAAPSGQAGGGPSASAGPPAGLRVTIRAADDPLWDVGRPPAGPMRCRRCGDLASWVFDMATGEWFGECLLGQGCRAGPNVAMAPTGPVVVGVDTAAHGVDRSIEAHVEVGPAGPRWVEPPPPAWSVVCDDVPRVVHLRDDGHVCANPRPRLP